MRHVVVGTAGHIDHGKTLLVKALTGIDTDRLREEKERGITIDLGFAHMELSPQMQIGIVDVPGHERFVRNMVAGASGIDLVMLVIAADEGVMPQTREHLAICQFLGVGRGLVVLTKSDLVDKAWLEVVRHDVEAFLQGTFLEGTPVVATSAVTGEGLEDLKARLLDLCLQVPPREEGISFRMPIDRVFLIKGFGLVVTGTVHSGCARVGDTLRVLPQGMDVRVRGLQIHGQHVEEVGPGCRGAINLAGVGKGDLERGNVLVTPGYFVPTSFLDASLRLLPRTRPLKNWARLRFHWGTGETMARVRLLDRDTLRPGDEAVVRVHLEESVVTSAGDAFVIRSFSPVMTVGGGRILDSNPFAQTIRRRILAERLQDLVGKSDNERVALFLLWSRDRGMNLQEILLKTSHQRETGGILEDLKRKGQVLALEDRYFHREALEGLEERVLGSLKGFFQKKTLRSFVSREELAHMVWNWDERVFAALLEKMAREGKVVLGPEGVSLPQAGPRLSPQEEKWLSFIREVFRKGSYSPPSLKEVFERGKIPPEKGWDLAKILLDKGDLVKVSRDMFLDSFWLRKMVDKLDGFFSSKEELTVGEFKDLLGVSRKYAVPYLEFLDAQGFTRRIGNVRKAKRLPSLLGTSQE